jgi:hypothetical protein
MDRKRRACSAPITDRLGIAHTSKTVHTPLKLGVILEKNETNEKLPNNIGVDLHGYKPIKPISLFINSKFLLKSWNKPFITLRIIQPHN